MLKILFYLIKPKIYIYIYNLSKPTDFENKKSVYQLVKNH